MVRERVAVIELGGGGGGGGGEGRGGRGGGGKERDPGYVFTFLTSILVLLYIPCSHSDSVC